MKKKCVLGCGHLVGGGGDRHAKFACPPPFKGGKSERRRQRRIEWRRKAREAEGVQSIFKYHYSHHNRQWWKTIHIEPYEHND